MLGVSSSADGYPGNWLRTCDNCQAAACMLYRYTDLACLCRSCDESIHAANPTALQHTNAWICSACENAPAAFTCQADAASLCINCDIEVHSANPLARRHNRVPISHISHTLYTSSTTRLKDLTGPILGTSNEVMANKISEEVDEDETDSWLLLDLDNHERTNGTTHGDEVDEYMDLVEYNSCFKYQCQDLNGQQQLSGSLQEESSSETIVPVQPYEAKEQDQQQQQQKLDCFVREYEASTSAISTTSSCQRVPVSSMDAGHLLKANSSSISNTFSRLPNRTTDRFQNSSLVMPLQLIPTNREARVLRYRQKRKARKFGKKIRYDSRKANAETRPRVKGRFVRKTGMDYEVDQMLSTEDCGYGIVPSC